MELRKRFKTLYDDVGIVPLCNRKRDRAPHIGQFCFPLCWRCSSVALGLTVCYALHSIIPDVFPDGKIDWSMSVLATTSIVLIFPMIWDGWRQYVKGKESTNWRRILTGTLCGVGLWYATKWLVAFMF